MLLEGEAPGRVLGLLGDVAPERLVHVAVTPFGQDGDYPAVVDLTAAGRRRVRCGPAATTTTSCPRCGAAGTRAGRPAPTTR